MTCSCTDSLRARALLISRAITMANHSRPCLCILQDAYITDQDLQIGKVVNIFARHWELLDADHNSCKYMEAHKDKYPHADFDKVIHCLQPIKS